MANRVRSFFDTLVSDYVNGAVKWPLARTEKFVCYSIIAEYDWKRNFALKLEISQIACFRVISGWKILSFVDTYGIKIVVMDFCELRGFGISSRKWHFPKLINFLQQKKKES